MIHGYMIQEERIRLYYEEQAEITDWCSRAIFIFLCAAHDPGQSVPAVL